MWSSTIPVIAEIDEAGATRSQVEVRDNGGCKGVFATEDIMEDSVVFVLRGSLSHHPTRYTIELGLNRHLNFPALRTANDDLDYCWQFLNHSCEPNGYMSTADLTFRAARTIRCGEEITFNYLTTESVMAVPFSCFCGSADCLGFIKGRNFLNADQLRRISLDSNTESSVSRFLEFILPKSGGNTASSAR